tara:strand:+ start:256 stop:471 length:216 start_codon:yes stop_codon:yes gene_type:complete
MSEGKSGYEIRADLLAQAEGILYGNIDREIQAANEHNHLFPENITPIPVRKITAAQVIRVARQLNEFVTEK